MKNTIIRKLTSMMGISRENLNEVEESGNHEVNGDDKRTKRHSSYCLTSNPSVNAGEDKLQKNRESARKARIRKKLYVKLLEQKVAKLKEFAAEGKTVERDMQAFITTMKAHIGEKKDLFQLKSVLYNNMQNVVSSSQPVSDESVKSLLASYQAKLGPSSSDRFSSIDKQVSEI